MALKQNILGISVQWQFGLVPNRHYAINRSNFGQTHWRICALLGLNKSMIEVMWKMYSVRRKFNWLSVSKDTHGIEIYIIASTFRILFWKTYYKASINHMRTYVDRQVSRAGTCEYIPQLCWGVMACPSPSYRLLAHTFSYIWAISPSTSPLSDV